MNIRSTFPRNRAIASAHFLRVCTLKTDDVRGVCGAKPRKHLSFYTFRWEPYVNMRLPYPKKAFTITDLLTMIKFGAFYITVVAEQNFVAGYEYIRNTLSSWAIVRVNQLTTDAQLH